MTVSLDEVLLDGGWVAHVQLASDDAAPLEGLTNPLRAKRELWLQTHPHAAALPALVLLATDERAPASVVKRVLRAAALAGHPNESFVVWSGP